MDAYIGTNTEHLVERIISDAAATLTKSADEDPH